MSADAAADARGPCAHRPLPYPLLPVLRAGNGAGLIHPDDRKLRHAARRRPGQRARPPRCCAPTSTTCATTTPPSSCSTPRASSAASACSSPRPTRPKRVWFLDLGHPAFGMSPLRLTGSDPLPLQATAIADNIVAALLDINENQIFQSSRRYLYHAVIGALALAAKQRPPRPLRGRLPAAAARARPTSATAVYQACADTPDLDQTAEFFRTELPQDLAARRQRHRPAPRRPAQQGQPAHRRPAAAALLQPHQRRRARPTSSTPATS